MRNNIGFLIMNFNNVGGTEQVTALIANELVNRGYNITIFSCQYGLDNIANVNKNIKIFSLKGELYSNPISRKIHVYKLLEKIVKEQKIDIMISVDVALYLYLFPLQKKLNIKCVSWEHFNFDIKLSKLTTLSRFLSAKYSDCIVVLTNNDYNNYKNHFSSINRLECIYNPVRFDFENNLELKEKRVIAVGRLAEEKGFDMLIHAWSIVEQKDDEWRLDIIGDGYLRSKLQELINSYNLKRCTLYGYSTNIEQEYRSSSLFVLSSRFEGFGLVLLEALSKSIPVIAFNCPGGVSEIIHDGKNGFLIKTGDINELANRLILLMNDKELRYRMANNTKIGLERFSLDNIITKWITLFNEI